LSLIGYRGRSAKSAEAACAFAGAGRALSLADLASADVVLLAVQDDQLPGLVRELAAASVGWEPPGVWVHASGSHGLEVLQPMRESGASAGAMHPICPFPDAETGYRNLPGQPAVVLVADRSDPAAEVLGALCDAATLRPWLTTGGDRVVYHAACVLAANGLTALHSMVEELLERALPDVDASQIAQPLMRSALDSCERSGSTAALSGPVLRGDAELLARQIESLASSGPEVVATYRGLMQRAASMAQARGALSAEALTAVRRALSGDA